MGVRTYCTLILVCTCIPLLMLLSFLHGSVAEKLQAEFSAAVSHIDYSYTATEMYYLHNQLDNLSSRYEWVDPLYVNEIGERLWPNQGTRVNSTLRESFTKVLPWVWGIKDRGYKVHMGIVGPNVVLRVSGLVLLSNGYYAGKLSFLKSMGTVFLYALTLVIFLLFLIVVLAALVLIFKKSEMLAAESKALSEKNQVSLVRSHDQNALMQDELHFLEDLARMPDSAVRPSLRGRLSYLKHHIDSQVSSNKEAILNVKDLDSKTDFSWVQSIESVRSRYAETVSISVPENLVVHANLELIKSINDNLVRNALISNSDRCSVQFYCKTYLNEVVVHARNDGVCIEDRVARQLFQKNVSSSSGHGIGLLYQKRLLNKMGDDIWLSSNKMGHVEFSYKLPLSKSVGHVLLLEDNPKIATKWEDSLCKEGFKVSRFHSVEALEDALFADKDQLRNLSAVVSDYMMGPKSLEQTPFFELLEFAGFSGPLFLTTAEDGLVSQGIKDRFSRIFSKKPVPIKEFV